MKFLAARWIFLFKNMNPIVKKFGDEKRWVNWRFEIVNDNLTKVPYFSATKKSASDNPATWRMYDEVTMALDNAKNKFDGYGLMFKPDQLLLGIDIDKCLNKETHKIEHAKKHIIEQLLAEAKTYTELSPSKTGLHLYFILTKPLPLVAHKSKKEKLFECYTDGRYFTVTETPYEHIPLQEIRTITPEEALTLLSIIGYPWETTSDKDVFTASEKENFDDETILEKMFASKSGVALRKLYDGDTSQYKNDESSADAALCASFAFWTGRNRSQIERLWLASPLGQRKKTKDRKYYRDRTIDFAIKNCKEIYETREMKMGGLDLLFIWGSDKKKIFIQNIENMYRILRDHKDFQGRFRLDTFKNKIEIFDKNKWHNIEDVDIVNTQTHISILFPFFGKVGKETVADAIMKVSKEYAIDSAVQYFSSLQWDKAPRLNTWLNSVYNAPQDVYHGAVGANWLKGLVKRVIEPGCKFDYVLALHGPQGIKKSTSLMTLVGQDWYLETIGTPDNKDFFDQFRGKLIVEFSEGETLSRSDIKKMKAVITMQTDTYRPAYGRFSMDFPRRCVFAMTTNQDEFLKDETGNRRWLPVACDNIINVEWLETNRDQLFAEAYHRVVNLKETTYEFPQEETLRAQEDRRIKDPNTDLVVEWYYDKVTEQERLNGITISRVYKEVLHGGFSSKPMNKWDEMQIADILRSGLKLEKRRVIREGRSIRWFRPFDPTPEEIQKSPAELFDVF